MEFPGARAFVVLTIMAGLSACVVVDDGRGGNGGRGGSGGGGLFGFGGGQTVDFECDDDREFTARFLNGGDRVRVDVGDDSYELEREGRGQYGDDDVILYLGGDETRLRIKDASDYANCRGQR